jgi:hypothetical protein
MTLRNSLGGTAAACLLVFGVSASATAAQTREQPLQFTVTVTGHAADRSGAPSDHFMTFSAPIEIPGVGLSPGTYLFRFVTPSIVQVLSADRSHVYGMFLTTPAEKSDESDRSEMTFERQTEEKAPVRIAGWFMQPSAEGLAPVYSHG